MEIRKTIPIKVDANEVRAFCGMKRTYALRPDLQTR